ncbi:hypothetical protein ACOI1H_14620 [Loktanella sp. DJP18]|uniref:hypothetical protein n=1 Tax=Loktanella sp. DJP18 TaxID=3409788 RepID=UPI003BB7DF42
MTASITHPDQPRYRLAGMYRSMTLIGDTLHFVDTQKGISLEAMAATPLPDDKDALEEALIVALDEIAEREDVRRNLPAYWMIRDIQDGLAENMHAHR